MHGYPPNAIHNLLMSYSPIRTLKYLSEQGYISSSPFPVLHLLIIVVGKFVLG